MVVSCPDPSHTGEGYGLVTIERFLGCAESAVLISGKPIRLQNEQPACDKRVTCKYVWIRARQR